MGLDDPGILDGMYMCKLRNNIVEDNAQPSGRRFVIPLGNHKEMPCGTNLVKLEGTRATAVRNGNNTITLTADVFTEPGCEMPVINKKFAGRKYTYFYANGTIAENAFRNAIYKLNVNDRSCKFWRSNEYMFPGEPVFVPNTSVDGGSGEEDDGILIAAVSNVKKGENDVLVFIDARSMTLIGRCCFRNALPPSVHGLFIPS